MVKNSPCNVGDADSTPGQKTKIPYVVGQLSPHATSRKAHMPQQRSRGLQLRPNTVRCITLHDTPYMWNPNRNDTNELLTKQKEIQGTAVSEGKG